MDAVKVMFPVTLEAEIMRMVRNVLKASVQNQYHQRTIPGASLRGKWWWRREEWGRSRVTVAPLRALRPYHASLHGRFTRPPSPPHEDTGVPSRCAPYSATERRSCSGHPPHRGLVRN